MAATTTGRGCGHLDALFEKQCVEAKLWSPLSITDYVQAMQGDCTGMPPRPLLVTFDDGRLDAYRGADDVLRAVYAKDTKYVMTVELNRNGAFRMLGAEVDAAFASGRWDIQLHAHGGHVRVPAGVDASGAPVFRAFFDRVARSSALSGVPHDHRSGPL